MPLNLAIREADKGDYDAIANVWHAGASRMDGLPGPTPGLDDFRARLEKELAEGWELFAACDGVRIVGMLALKPRERRLDQLFVLPSEHGRGIGRALLDFAKRRMVDGFRLRTPAFNEAAQRFYAREGLRPAGEGRHPSNGRPVRFYEWPNAAS
ncbi:GNAT family N-acetyltransferase [Consotaella aegiceratis]|uniref:GNAT family N-acetyltransferase n=1 Tax=Consotaella aegiceratis TaxID=3097961 RepID=UPI002F4177E6